MVLLRHQLKKHFSGTLGWSDYMDRDFGFQTFWSFIPHPVPIFPSEMNFYQRCYNVLFSLFDVFVRHYSYLPAQDKIAKEYFKDAISGELPYVGDLEKKISVMLINHHRALSPIRPLMPGQINVAGAHIKPPKPLPNDIKVLIISTFLVMRLYRPPSFSEIPGSVDARSRLHEPWLPHSKFVYS